MWKTKYELGFNRAHIFLLALKMIHTHCVSVLIGIGLPVCGRNHSVCLLTKSIIKLSVAKTFSQCFPNHFTKLAYLFSQTHSYITTLSLCGTIHVGLSAHFIPLKRNV